MTTHSFIMTAVLSVAACAPADVTYDAESNPFQAQAELGTDPLEDAGFLAAKGAAEADRDALRDQPVDIDREIERASQALEDAGCRRVAYTVIRWRNSGHQYRGLFFDLNGQVVANHTGYFAPVNGQGGTFAGPWQTGMDDEGNARGGPMGGIYTGDQTLTGTVTYGTLPFHLRGKWAPRSEHGGIAVGVVAYCG